MEDEVVLPSVTRLTTDEIKASMGTVVLVRGQSRLSGFGIVSVPSTHTLPSVPYASSALSVDSLFSRVIVSALSFSPIAQFFADACHERATSGIACEHASQMSDSYSRIDCTHVIGLSRQDATRSSCRHD